MAVEPNLLGYLAGVGVVAVLVGLAIGYVVRAASTRRQVSPLQAEVGRLKTALAEAQQSGVASPQAPQPAPRRLTATELVAILGAVGTLVSSTAAFYNNYQGKSLKELQDRLAAAETKQKSAEADLAKLRTDTRTVLGFSIDKWLQIDKVALPAQRPKKSETFQVSDREVTGPCDDPRLQLTYNGFAPSVLRCTGRAVIRLPQASRIMLAPDASPK